MIEILNKTLTSEGLEDQRKFEFVAGMLNDLDSAKRDIENYPIVFIFQLAEFLGFAIPSTGSLVKTYSQASLSTQQELIIYFDSLSAIQPKKTSIDLRKKALHCLINYYQDQYDNFGDLKSASVLSQVFS